MHKDLLKKYYEKLKNNDGEKQIMKLKDIPIFLILEKTRQKTFLQELKNLKKNKSDISSL